MKYSLVICCCIGYFLILQSKSFAQQPIDSIFIQLMDIQVRDTGYTSDRANYVNHDVIRTYSYNYSLKLIKDSIYSDTSVFLCEDQPHPGGQICQILTQYDTAKESSDTLYFNETRPGLSLPDYDQSGLSLSKTVLRNTDFDYEINLDSSGLAKSGFDYHYRSFSRYSSGYIAYWLNFTGIYLPTSHLSIKIKKHVPISQVSFKHDMPPALIVYPNPASNLVNLEVNDATSGLTLSVLDILGRELKSILISDKMPQVDLSAFSPGIYYFRAGSQVRRLVIR